MTSLKTQLKDQNERMIKVTQDKARLEAKNKARQAKVRHLKKYHIRGVGMPKNLGEGGILKTQFKGKNQNKIMIKVTKEPDLRPKIRPERQR